MNKQALRAQTRAQRDAFAAGTPPPIPADPAFTARLHPGLTVATYALLASEADPRQLTAAARRAGCRLALPHVVGRATPLRFLLWPDDASLAPGPFGLANPHPHWPEAAPDVILTPLLAFDAQLNRLGQGAGHYDRAFAAHPHAWRVGVAWSVQQVDELPFDKWDVPLHAVATEQGWWPR